MTVELAICGLMGVLGVILAFCVGDIFKMGFSPASMPPLNIHAFRANADPVQALIDELPVYQAEGHGELIRVMGRFYYAKENRWLHKLLSIPAPIYQLYELCPDVTFRKVQIPPFKRMSDVWNTVDYLVALEARAMLQTEKQLRDRLAGSTI